MIILGRNVSLTFENWLVELTQFLSLVGRHSLKVSDLERFERSCAASLN